MSEEQITVNDVVETVNDTPVKELEDNLDAALNEKAIQNEVAPSAVARSPLYTQLPYLSSNMRAQPELPNIHQFDYKQTKKIGNLPDDNSDNGDVVETYWNADYDFENSSRNSIFPERFTSNGGSNMGGVIIVILMIVFIGICIVFSIKTAPLKAEKYDLLRLMDDYMHNDHFDSDTVENNMPNVAKRYMKLRQKINESFVNKLFVEPIELDILAKKLVGKFGKNIDAELKQQLEEFYKFAPA